MSKSISIDQIRVAITGGTGFVGSAIARRLLMEGVPEVVLLSRRRRFPLLLNEWRESGRLKIVGCDIRDRTSVLKAMTGCDVVFHQAALRVTQCARDPALASTTLVDGTTNVVSACAVLGVKKIVAASSAIVYGEAMTLPISESHPLQDETLYGLAKIQNERLLHAFWKHFGLNYTALRYFNVYGPGMTITGEDIEVLIRWLNSLNAGMSPMIFGDGNRTLDWVFIDDVVEANWRALLFPGSGEVFNVCSGQETTLFTLLEVLCRVAGKTISPKFGPVRTVNHVVRRFGDPRKAEERLGFRAHIGLEDGLARLAKWHDGMTAQRTA